MFEKLRFTKAGKTLSLIKGTCTFPYSRGIRLSQREVNANLKAKASAKRGKASKSRVLNVSKEKRIIKGDHIKRDGKQCRNYALNLLRKGQHQLIGTKKVVNKRLLTCVADELVLYQVDQNI